jgi:hypothetical protein
MGFFDNLADFILTAKLHIIIPVVGAVLSGLWTLVKIVTDVRKYPQHGGANALLQSRSDKKILGLGSWGKKGKPVDLVLHKTLVDGVKPKQAKQKTARVFISYKVSAQPDESLARFLMDALEKRGHQPFIHTMLPLGVEWGRALQRQIEASDCLVVLLSNASIKSEMVVEEVMFAEIHRSKFKHPNLLPIRVQYLKTLPYGLANHLDSKQFALWMNEKDSKGLLDKIISAIEMEHTELPQESAMIEADEGDSQRPLPSFDPRILEIPAGAVKLQSPFYIRRDSDERMERQIQSGGGTISIRAGRQMGKTSLLVRAANFARQQEQRVVYIDFQQIKAEFRDSLDSLLRYMADEITLRLNLDEAQLTKIWGSSRGSPDKFSQFMETIVLTDEKPLFLAMDEADQLMDVEYKTEFFALVRAWDSRRAFDEAWARLSLAMVISSHPHLLIDDYRQSPFNVGLRIQLEDFDADQIETLNKLHGAPLNREEMEGMMKLLGGHPFLTRQAFYTLLDEKMTWADFLQVTTSEKSPFNSHLHFYLWQLRDRPELVSGMKAVIKKHTCPDEGVLYRLVAAGLVREQSDRACVPRCGLYENYFRKTLNA